jgi:hypothetical protein
MNEVTIKRNVMGNSCTKMELASVSLAMLPHELHAEFTQRAVNSCYKWLFVVSPKTLDSNFVSNPCPSTLDVTHLP